MGALKNLLPGADSDMDPALQDDYIDIDDSDAPGPGPVGPAATAPDGFPSIQAIAAAARGDALDRQQQQATAARDRCEAEAIKALCKMFPDYDAPDWFKARIAKVGDARGTIRVDGQHFYAEDHSSGDGTYYHLQAVLSCGSCHQVSGFHVYDLASLGALLQEQHERTLRCKDCQHREQQAHAPPAHHTAEARLVRAIRDLVAQERCC